MLPGRLAKWVILLAPFDIKFMPQKTIRGQAIADFLVAYMCLDNEELLDDVQDEVMLTETRSWQLYFDGAASSRGTELRIVFVTPSGGLIPYSISLLEICSNNVVEYEALIIGLELALKVLIDQFEVFSDSQLII